MIETIIFERNVPWIMDQKIFMQLDVFIAIGLTSIILQMTSIYHGWRNYQRLADRRWRFLWLVFCISMFGIMMRRIWAFTILLDTCAVVGEYYHLLIEALFQLFLSTMYVYFASGFNHLNCEVKKKIGVTDG